MGAEWHLGNYSTVCTRKGGSWGQGRSSGGGEKWLHSGCILNTEPMTLAVNFIWAKKERRVKNDCKDVTSSLTQKDGIVQNGEEQVGRMGALVWDLSGFGCS